LFKVKACEKYNHRHISDIPRSYPPKFGGGLFFEHNTETCPPLADWAKRPFMDGKYLRLLF